MPLPKVATDQGIVPGIKVDKGTLSLANASGDSITQGLNGLAGRLVGYKEQGARYAAICQSLGIVPIVEPEVLLDGDYIIERCLEVTEVVQHAVFHALHRHRVELVFIVLKPSMIVPGKDAQLKAAPDEIAEKTLRQLLRSVPAAVPGINFSFGRTDT